MPKKEKDPFAPRRNLSAYLLYQNAMRDSFQIENPKMDFAQLAKHTSKMYCEMPDDHKESWRRRAEEDKKRYAEEMGNYTPPPGYDSKGNAIVQKLKKHRDPDAPRRNRSAYILFQKSVREKLQTDDRKLKLGELAKTTSKMYADLSIEDKAVWDEAASQEEARYEQAMKEYEPPIGYDEKGYLLESYRYLLKKKKKSKDPSFPKRPCGSYVYFTKAERPKLQAKLNKKGEKMNFTEMGHVLGETWRNLTPEEKAPYEKQANEDKERFNEELAKYRAEKGIEIESPLQHAQVVAVKQDAAQQSGQECTIAEHQDQASEEAEDTDADTEQSV